MGADLLVLTLDWPKRKEDLHRGFLKRCDEIDNCIDRLKKMSFGHEPCDVNPDWGLKDNKVMDMGVTPAKKVTLGQYKRYLHDLVDEFRGAWGGRDTVVQAIDNRWVFITGGMSWGDSPGETYAVLSKLYYAGVV